MSPPVLHLLPPEVLQNICSFVLEDHKPSLHNISLVSKHFHKAASGLLFRDLKLFVSGPKRLAREAKELHSILQGLDVLRHVRSLTLEGYLDLEADDEGAQEYPHVTKGHPKGPPKFTLSDSNYYGDDEKYDRRPGGSGVFVADGSPHVSDEQNEAWREVAELIKATKAIRDLFFDCNNVFAPLLLDTLHDCIPQCRLHLYHFRFRQLKNDMRLPHELKLITSPCLATIHVRYVYRDSNGDDDFNFDATRRAIAGVIPNLQHLMMFQERPAASSLLLHRRGEPIAEWRGFDDGIGPFKPAALKSVNILETSKVRDWSTYIDFSKMENMSLEGNVEVFNWATRACRPETLRMLNLLVGTYGSTQPMSAKSTAVVQLLKSIPGLKQLSLAGDVNEAMADAAFEHHGASLEDLDIRQHTHFQENEEYRLLKVDVPLLRKLEKNCPRIERLHLQVDRTTSDSTEVQLYRMFGRLPRLRCLFLELNCRCDEHGGRKRLLMNAAFDEALARSIWNVMFAEQPKNGRLQSLRLVPRISRMGYSVNLSLDSRLREVNRAFQIDRSARDDSDDIEVRELGQKARLARLEQSYITKTRGTLRVDEIWESVWPAKSGSDTWLHDWESVPLDLGTKESL